MASSIPEATLNLPHTFRDWEEDDIYHCMLSVTMPDGNVTSFGGKGSSARKARTLATFNASYAVKMQALDGDDRTSSDDTDQDEQTRHAEGSRFARGETFTSEWRAVQEVPSPVQSVESASEDEDEQPADSRRDNSRQSDSMHDQDSDIDFDEEAPLLISHSMLRATPGIANERDAIRPSRALHAGVATVDPVVDSDDSSAHDSMLAQAVESQRMAEKRPGDERATNQRKNGVADGEKSPDAHSRGTQLMSNAHIVDFDSDTSESSDDEVGFVRAVPESQAKKSPSPVRENERLAYNTEGNVDGRQAKVNSSQLSQPAQVARTESLSTPQFQQSQTIKLFTYHDEESEDSSLEPTKRGRKTVFRSNDTSPPHTAQYSSSSADEMEKFNHCNTPAWLRQHSGNQTSAKQNASSDQLFTKSSAKRRRKPRGSLRSSCDYVPDYTSSAQSFRANQQHKSHIVEPSVPDSNVRSALANRSNHPVGVSSLRTVDQPGWKTTPGTRNPFAPSSCFNADGNVKMHSAPTHRVDPLHPHNRSSASMRKQQSGIAMNGASNAFPAQYARGQARHATNVHPTSQETNGMPPHLMMNGPPIPTGMNDAMPANLPHSAMFSNPRFMSAVAPIQNPFPTASQNLPPHLIYGPSIQHQQFSPHPVPNSMHGPYPFQLGMGGMLNPFGQAPKSDLHSNLENIRRAAIANAQAAVERDLPDKNRNSQGHHDIGPGGGTRGSSIKNQYRQGRANAVDRFDQFHVQVEGSRMDEGKEKHAKVPTTDSGGSLKRRRTTYEERVDVSVQNEELPTSLPGKEKIRAKPSTVIDKNLQGPADEHDAEDYVSALHSLVRRTKCSTDPVFEYSLENTGSGLWQCTVRVRRRSVDKVGEWIEKRLTARTRKKAKHRASKSMLAYLNEMLSHNGTAIPMKTEGAKSSSTSVEKGRGMSAAITALNQLWHWKILQSQPDARLEEVDGGKWKCTFLLMLADKGLVTISEVGSQKKAAKRYAAHKALDYLRELKVDGAERFKNVMSLSELHDKEKVSTEDVQEGEGVTEDIVKLSDDEDGEIQDKEEIDDIGSRFVLPKNYKLTVATTPQDCDDWVKENAQGQSDIGFYLGSYDNMICHKDMGRGGQVGRSTRERGTSKDPVLCFSNQTAGLVLRADKCTDSESKELDVVNGIWLPMSVRSLLGNNRICKHGLGFDDVMMRLLKEHGIRARAMNDLAVTSFAVTGFCSNNGAKILWTIQELTKHWLQKELDVTSSRDIWEDSTDMPSGLGELDGVELGTAVLQACVCTQVREQVSLSGVRKRTQLYGPAAEFQELSKRLMYSPFVMS